MDPETDDALWRRSLHCDDDAFAVLFNRHHTRVHRHAARLLSSPTDAEDVTAAAFFELWRRREQVHLVGGSVLPWLLVTATNLARNTHRGTRRYRDLLHRLRAQPGQHTTPDVAHIFADEHLSDEHLSTALQALKGIDLQLITLVVLEGFTLTEAASLLSFSSGAAKTRLHRARTRLQAALAEHPGASRLRTPEGQHP